MTNTKINGPVWVLDDDIVRESIVFTLKQHHFSAVAFSSAKNFFSGVNLHQAGCLVLDLRMPEMDGHVVQNKLIKANSPISIVFLSGHGSVDDVVTSMVAGAVTFLEKPVKPEKLAYAVEQGLRASLKRLEEQQVENLLSNLTEREREIFKLICLGLKNHEIAERLYLSNRTVETHRARITTKLKDNAPISLIYKLLPDEKKIP